MMNLLAIDSSTERAALGLSTRHGGIYTASIATGSRHGRDLIPRLADLLAEAGVDARAIDVVSVGLGPGSFTGLRVGVMAAKTLAYVAGAAIIGVDSLAVVARNAPSDSTRISVIGDAQRGDLYVAEFVRPNPGGPLVQTHPSHVTPLDRWLAGLEPGHVVVGPGLESPRIAPLIPREFMPASPCSNYPRGLASIELAREVWISGRRDNPWTLEPNYLRKSSAEEKWDGANPSFVA